MITQPITWSNDTNGLNMAYNIVANLVDATTNVESGAYVTKDYGKTWTLAGGTVPSKTMRNGTRYWISRGGGFSNPLTLTNSIEAGVGNEGTSYTSRSIESAFSYEGSGAWVPHYCSTDDRIYMAMHVGGGTMKVAYSSDYGDTWSTVTMLAGTGYQMCLISMVDNNVGYMILATVLSNEMRVYKTTNNWAGNTFVGFINTSYTLPSNPPLGISSYTDFKMFDENIGYLCLIDEAAATTKVIRTSNGGSTWSQVLVSGPPPRYLTIEKVNGRYFIHDGNGNLYRSDSGIIFGVSASISNSRSISSSNGKLLIVYTNDTTIHISTNGANFRQINAPSGKKFALSDNTMFGGKVHYLPRKVSIKEVRYNREKVMIFGQHGTPPYQYALDSLYPTYQSSPVFAISAGGSYTAKIKDSAGVISTTAVNIPFFTNDTDVQAFITATGITNDTQKTAIDTLVKSLKTNSLWTKFQAIYPFVGGTATTHKYNLKNPLDTDGAFRLVFNGTVTHDASGVTGNGTTGWIDTFYNPRTSATLNDHSISIYGGTNVAGGYDIGANDGTYENAIIARWTNNISYSQVNNASANTIASTDSRGYFMVSRTASNVVTTYKNGTAIINGTSASVNTPNRNYGLMVLNQTSRTGYSTRRLQFATIGTSLTGTQASTMYTIVQAYQTALSRNV